MKNIKTIFILLLLLVLFVLVFFVIHKGRDTNKACIRLAGVLGFDIAADRQVVVVGHHLLQRDGQGKVIGIFLAVEYRHDLLDVCIQQHIVVCFFLEQPTGINKLGGGIGFVFGQHQNIHCGGGAKKQVRRERNHAFNVVVIY